MSYIQNIIENLKISYPIQNEFHQAVTEVLISIEPILKQYPIYQEHKVIERIIEPEREIYFRVSWVDDKGCIQVNKGYRVEFSSVLGPYKGGLRFHPSVNESIMKFLGFEQIFKNSLTGLMLGGAKGGSNFDPKGKSDNEIMRFCQSYMSELFRHIGAKTDVPAGDIGVGAKEIGYLFGMYKKLVNRYDGVLTGKSTRWGGSMARKEATGYGIVYFAKNLLEDNGLFLEGKRCIVSGSGNVAIYTMEKLLLLGAKVIACSDSKGIIHDEHGIDLELIKKIKDENRGSLEEYQVSKPNSKYIAAESYPENRNLIWSIPCDIAFPCATQNELNINDAKELIKNGVKAVIEGANMPSTPDAIKELQAHNVLFAPSKAANAGGVATSGFEMAQNASMQKWDFDEVEDKLSVIMKNIYTTSLENAKIFDNSSNLVIGANIAGFKKVADAMIEQGVV
ncbi:MAG: glutamate dehydrogenase [Sulfurovum sp. AS07-7]|nr:MAG: glutamate dehydrogenase [Sulfurovum sp. AS07-7]